ncbi:uncharacterized protein LOC129911781 isoform X2 [Episyrphus balteatus]|uniref:uncharacterized protein LOC129911781 isoform X2 n=1 Tax=Episyrphus balteatus TaxID=286459 RepID=UPI00248682D7|nr:uncharacterized protein LOC129911781 isoform X2 [Episyrphus balteatus]
MENKTIKNNDSSASSGTTPSEIENSFKFMNSSFVENSDSSVQADIPAFHPISRDQAIRNASKSYTRDYQINRPAANKILPSSLCKLSEEPSTEDDLIPEEKTLVEIGFKANQIEDWESINQPKKQDLYGLLKNMIDKYIKPNVQIRVGDVSFNCHMMVLQCYSDFFMDCSNESVIQLPPEKITAQAFMMIYDWMLSADPLVQREGILELFNAANFLKIKGLVDQCWVCLDDDIRFQEDTAFLLYLEARNYGLEMLQQLMLTRICKFFLTLVASKDFLLLSANEICTLLSSNSIGVNSEVEILMSAVRWLSYNWTDRQCHMLDLLKCVRFGLMPPWILVALGRDTDCEAVQRVIDNAEVKKMIEDGLSYTTTKLYYSKNIDNFLAFMERYKLTKPIQRQWICDEQCDFHHKTDCPNRLYITYKSFLEYLEMIRSKGKDHWKTLHMEHQKDLNFQCCLPKLNSSNDQYFYCVVPKESRDQAVQANGELSDPDDADMNAISQTVDIKTSWYQEIYSSNRPNARGLENIPKIRTQDTHNNKNSIATKRDNKNITLSQKSSSCCDVNQKPINIKKSVLAKAFYCSMSSEHEFEYSTMANSMCHHQQQRHQDIVEAQKLTQGRTTNMSSPLKKGADDDDDGDVGKDEDCSTSKAASAKQIGISRKQDSRSELNLDIGKQKIFLFGGIDPYAQRNCSNGQGMDVLYYDSCENAWKYLSNMPGSRHHHSAAVYRGRIYVVGGTRPPLPGSVKSIFETAVWSFDPKRLEWHNETFLPQSRRDFGMIAYDNDVTYNKKTKINAEEEQGDAKGQTRTGLFIFGGESIDGTPLSSMFYYNVEKKIWSEEASLNIGRYGLASTVVVNTKNTAEIWVAGGVCGHEKGGHPIITDSMECYNLTSDDDGCWSWKELIIRLRIPRLFSKFCTTNRGTNLYIIGGIGLDPKHPGEFKSLASIDRYDFHEQNWTHLTDMIISRHGHDVASINNKILIFGGVSGSERKTLKSVECFSTKTNTWLYEIAFLPLPLSGLTAIVIDSNFSK